MVGTRSPLLIVLAVLMLFMAGCLGGGKDKSDGAATASSPDNDGGTGTEDADGSANETLTAPEPTVMTLFLTADHKLAMEPPEAGAATQGIFLDDYAQGQFDVNEFSWLADPLTMPAMIVHGSITMTLWIESDAPIAPFASAGPVVVGFLGSTKGLPLTQAAEAPPGPFLPGTPTKFDLTLEFAPPALPVVLPAGEAFKFFGGLSATTTDQSPARILVGGDHASAVTFTHVMLLEDPLAGATAPATTTATGTFAANDPPKDSTFPIGPNATFVDITVRPTSGQQALDLDLALLDAAGGVLATSTTPANVETIYVAGPALESLRGTDVTVRVSQFNAAQAAYEVTFTQG